MDIISENVLDAPVASIEQMLEEAISQLAEYGAKVVDEVLKEYMPLLKDVVNNLTGQMKGFAFGKEVEVLDMQTLVGMAKKYIVPKSNEIVAIKVKQEDGCFIYLAYSRDRELLPAAENKYVIIKAQSLAKDVEDLFAESELVILK